MKDVIYTGETIQDIPKLGGLRVHPGEIIKDLPDDVAESLTASPYYWYANPDGKPKEVFSDIPEEGLISWEDNLFSKNPPPHKKRK